MRVPRYRIYLVMYGGVGISVVIASVLRFTAAHDTLRVVVSSEGVRAALGIVAFWTAAGLRMAFISPGNQRGGWLFRAIHGRPPEYKVAMEELAGAKVWALVCTAGVTAVSFAALRAISPWQLVTWPATAAQIVTAAGMCLLLADVFFLKVTTVAFTGAPREQESLAFTMLKFFTFFPFVIWLPLVCEPWMERGVWNLTAAVAGIGASHLLLESKHRKVVREFCELIWPEDREEEFPMRLGLRY